ncbi:hypothetical protein C5G87_06910 [Paenibacillus peoriae]|uniref:hypothetical protein n=1 Tax=Paenibacillus peoriae TaxID=59893 RepID=UPI000CEBD2DF|nr:hypothetical protein [Paenibacillus peoriae]PPQ49099.1 hypothetical protein C5G87_06910 [Paenibacillus peoriae]
MPVDMIDEKLDFALAGLLGWVNVWDGVRLIWVDGATKEFRRKVTDWQPSSDPAASLEVQAKAIEVDEGGYFTNLLRIRGVLESPSLLNAYRAIALASPRESAEAAYMTLSSQDLHPLREDI